MSRNVRSAQAKSTERDRVAVSDIEARIRMGGLCERRAR
jgi:hypothetical protein